MSQIPSEERNRAYLKNAPHAVFVVDDSGRYVEVHVAACAMTGYDAAELCGLRFTDLVLPKRRAQVTSSFVELQRCGKISIELDLLCEDGSTVPVALDAVTLPNGHHMAFCVDLSERKRAEEALRASEERFRAIVTHSQPIIFVMDAKGIFELSEGKSLATLGLEPGQVVGLSAFDVYEEVPAILHGVREALAGRFHNDIIDVGGIHFDTFYSPRYDAQGKVDGLIGMAIDITERKRAEEQRSQLEAQVQQAQKMESLGVLAGGVAHDFNNLLTSILGNADLALSDLLPTSGARGHVEEVIKASRRAAELCGQMLAYSGRGRFVVGPVDLTALVQEMAHLLEVSVSKKASIEYSFADTLPNLNADATQLRQIVMNLITNASEALGDDPGSITVSTGIERRVGDESDNLSADERLPAGTYVYVEVADTGCGMDDETRARLFEPFFTTKFTGRGLGMAAVLGIVHGHRGAIRVESDVGRGSTLRALFPASDGTPAEVASTGGTENGWRGHGTVLLVDDERHVRDVVSRMLARLGFDVVTANDGERALAVFRERPDDFTCVLLDLTMPRMDGDLCSQELYRIRGDMPIVISSGYTEQEIASRFKHHKLGGFIHKPYELASLTAVLKRVLRAE